MTTAPLQSVLCRYHYDALDRSITWTPDRQAGLQRFFCKDRLATEIQNAAQRSIFQHDDQVLAQQNRWGDKVDTTLLATDHQRSVLNAVDLNLALRIAYTPYGHRPLGNGLLSLLGFNGERPDLVTGHYHLGNGYRQFNPVLMRFNSPDKLSPFGKGGVNAYAYCGNDPVNWTDPQGSLRLFRKSISSTRADYITASMIQDNLNIKYGKETILATSDNFGTIDLKTYSDRAQKKINKAMEARNIALENDLKFSVNYLENTNLKLVEQIGKTPDMLKEINEHLKILSKSRNANSNNEHIAIRIAAAVRLNKKAAKTVPIVDNYHFLENDLEKIRNMT